MITSLHIPNDFLLVRHGRDVIKDAAMRATHLLHPPAPERTCPIEAVFYRRWGMRIVWTGVERVVKA